LGLNDGHHYTFGQHPQMPWKKRSPAEQFLDRYFRWFTIYAVARLIAFGVLLAAIAALAR